MWDLITQLLSILLCVFVLFLSCHTQKRRKHSKKKKRLRAGYSDSGFDTGSGRFTRPFIRKWYLRFIVVHTRKGGKRNHGGSWLWFSSENLSLDKRSIPAFSLSFLANKMFLNYSPDDIQTKYFQTKYCPFWANWESSMWRKLTLIRYSTSNTFNINCSFRLRQQTKTFTKEIETQTECERRVRIWAWVRDVHTDWFWFRHRSSWMQLLSTNIWHGRGPGTPHNNAGTQNQPQFWQGKVMELQKSSTKCYQWKISTM